MIYKLINYLKRKMIRKDDIKKSDERITRYKKIKKRDLKQGHKKNEEKILKQIEEEKTNKLIELSEINHKQDDFICSICLNFISKTITTVCGHNFCEICIYEYLLYFVVN